MKELILALLKTPDSKDKRCDDIPTRDVIFLSIARLISYRSTCRRGGCGSVITVDNRIVSIGYTGAPPGMKHCIDYGCIEAGGGCIRTLHAESNAIAWAARSGISIVGGTLYTTMSPCLACAKLIVASGLKKVICIDRYRDTNGIDFIKEANLDITYVVGVDATSII